MINLQKEYETYITGVEKKDEEEKSIQYSSSSSPYKNKQRNNKSSEHSEKRENKKIISIVFPIIKPHRKYKLSNLFFTNKKEINNNSEQIYKSQKTISVAISKLRNKTNNYLYNENNINKRNNNNSIDNDSKNNSLTNNDYCITSINEENKPFIKNIEYNFNLEKNNNIKSYNKFNNNFCLNSPSPSSKTQILKQKLFNKEQQESIFNAFLKKELKMEQKLRLFPTFLQRFSPRLLRKKKTIIKKIDNKNYNFKTNDDEYKIRTVVFKNQTIPYVDKIDVPQMSSSLPPIILGSQFNLQERSEDSIKREKFYNEIERIERERKGKSEKKKKITKKEMLKMIRNKRLLNCKNLIHKTKRNISFTKKKLNRVYNRLKNSLNQYDDWNSPENVDNLYDN